MPYPNTIAARPPEPLDHPLFSDHGWCGAGTGVNLADLERRAIERVTNTCGIAAHEMDQRRRADGAAGVSTTAIVPPNTSRGRGPRCWRTTRGAAPSSHSRAAATPAARSTAADRSPLFAVVGETIRARGDAGSTMGADHSRDSRPRDRCRAVRLGEQNPAATLTVARLTATGVAMRVAKNNRHVEIVVSRIASRRSQPGYREAWDGRICSPRR